MIEMFPNVPLSAFSTLCFESSNSRIKRFLNVGSSFLNPCKTIIQKIAWNNFLDYNIDIEEDKDDESNIDKIIEWDYTIENLNMTHSSFTEDSENFYEEFNTLNDTLTSIIYNE
uniref:Dimer_Tnp_hAT domain-containing protein n=1 Tax=Strongyloides stercoralis TaxID=6248 RepID=A0A0K0EPR1_STRER